MSIDTDYKFITVINIQFTTDMHLIKNVFDHCIFIQTNNFTSYIFLT